MCKRGGGRFHSVPLPIPSHSYFPFLSPFLSFPIPFSFPSPFLTFFIPFFCPFPLPIPSPFHGLNLHLSFPFFLFYFFLFPFPFSFSFASYSLSSVFSLLYTPHQPSCLLFTFSSPFPIFFFWGVSAKFLRRFRISKNFI